MGSCASCDGAQNPSAERRNDDECCMSNSCDSCYVGNGCCAPSKQHYAEFAHVNQPGFDPVAVCDISVEPEVDNSSNGNNSPRTSTTPASYASDLSGVKPEGHRRHSKGRKSCEDHYSVHKHKRHSTSRDPLDEKDADGIHKIHKHRRHSTSRDSLDEKDADSIPKVTRSQGNNLVYKRTNINEADTSYDKNTLANNVMDTASLQTQQRLTRVLFSEDGQLSVVDIDSEKLTDRIHKATANFDLSPEDYRMELMSQVEALECEDKNGNRPLHIASYLGHLKHLHLLLEVGAEINARNNAGNTPLHLALSANHFEVAVKLKNKGAKDNIKNLAGFPASKGSRGTSSYATAALLSAINENHLAIALNMCETLELDHVDLGELTRCKDFVKRNLRDVWSDKHEDQIDRVILRLEDDLARMQSPARAGRSGGHRLQRVTSDDSFFIEEGAMAAVTHQRTEAKDKKDQFGSIFGFFCL